MSKSLIAIHTIHRPGRKKGETEIIAPKTHFVANSDEEAKFLIESGAAKLNESSEKPKRGRRKKAEKKEEAPAEEAPAEAPAAEDGGDEVL